ncbi:PO113 protein, partial [Jacana jacana]|nr:PO113 protein [Jacana jacana]
LLPDAVVRVFQKWDLPINIVTDSAYVAGPVPHLENACLKEVSNLLFFALLSKLLQLLNHRQHPYFIIHIPAHTTLPGPLAGGNCHADQLTLRIQVVLSTVEQARISHAFFHQNACALQKAFSLTVSQAQDTVAACLDCQRFYVNSSSSGVNP